MKKLIGWSGILIILAVLHSCKNVEKEKAPHTDNLVQEKKEPTLFTILNPLQTGIKFVNHLTETADMNGFSYEYYYNGAGVSLSDINNDGLQDILFISNLRKNQLYLNQGQLKFKDITEASGLMASTGYKTGVTNVDINSDGLMDYYISKSGRYDNPSKRKNELWVNQGTNDQGIPFFKEEATKYNLDIDMCSTQAAFFDYDLDGDLDMFLVNHYTSPLNYNDINELIEKEGKLTGDRLYENRNGEYTDVTKKAGISNTTRLSYGLGVSIGDLNNDGWPDVYVSNDYEGKDFLYLNQGDGTFKDVANSATAHVSFYSMGTDIADMNNDGWLDFMSLDMMAEDNYSTKTSMSAMNTEKFADVLARGLHHQYMYNALQVNNGTMGEERLPIFSDVAQLSGVAMTDWSWGPLFLDMDNDGHKDIFVSNGIKRDFRNNDFIIKQRTRTDKVNLKDREAFIGSVLDEMPQRKKQNYFFRNNGDLSFSKKNNIWLYDIPTSSNGAAYGDLDNDGDLDLVVNNSDDASLIYKNETVELQEGNFVKVRLKGPTKNPFGIGARLSIHYANKVQLQEHYLTRGFQSSVGQGIHFGLGNMDSVDELKVIWPDGKQQKIKNVSANQEIVVSYKDAIEERKYGLPFSPNTLFTSLKPEKMGLNWKHRENKFNDFERESLLPHKMSQFGPAMAVGDINDDGLDDIYVGGAQGQSSGLFVQNADGDFRSVQQTLWQKEKNYEDVDALFFDADKDGDLDLYVVSGGNEEAIGSSYYQDRFYENKENGFFRNNKAIPHVDVSGSIVRPIDYDNDGDLDLFVGGRQFPGKYPTAVSSRLLRNDSGKGRIKFVSVEASVLPELDNIGMVTDALVVDLDNDRLEDLVLVGEWMAIRAFRNTGKDFEEASEELGFQGTVGWWNTIKAADFDGDGDLDLVAGNLGLNYKYKASMEKPFKIYGNDFDKTGTFDIVLGYYEDENLYPLRGRQCSSDQMPFIKKKFKTYHEFGSASLEEVYGKEELEASISYGAQTFANTYFENRNGTFVAHALPNEAQITSINDIMVEDINKDGHLDMVIAGNLYGAEVETPRNDAGIGLYLKGDGKGGFVPIPMHQSGLYVQGEVKKIRKLSVGNTKQHMIFARNNQEISLIKWN
ncbi:VCBS repeat-containing protein [Flagellimonas sp.]|uniref:VCBS repeat-containing protein n=1 Tax=Flagellimonas sp. TaxID=2058762 RepID=UPI003B5132A7